VLILSTHGREAAPAMVQDLASRVDGMVVLGRTVADDVLRTLARKGVPLILMAREPVDWADSVNSENEQAARALTSHLAIDHGYRSFAFLGDAGHVDRHLPALERLPKPY
jgi:LacI family transcriptional regulator